MALVCMLVTEKNDPASERPCFQEPKVKPGVQCREHRFAPSQDHRIDVEPVLIDQAELDDGRRKIGTSQIHVLAGLPLQLRDLFADVTSDQPGIPFDPLKGLLRK